MIITGTCYFVTRKHAVKYYRAYGYRRQDVESKITREEIYIGMAPPIKPGDSRRVNGEGRYEILSPEVQS